MNTNTPAEQVLIDAALALAGESRTAAALLPIPNTTPKLFVAYGEAPDLARLAGYKLPAADNSSAAPSEPPVVSTSEVGKWNRRTLVERLYNEPPNVGILVEAGAEIQRLRAELNVVVPVGLPGKLTPAMRDAVYPKWTYSPDAMYADLLDSLPPAKALCGLCRRPIALCGCVPTSDGPGQPDAAPEVEIDEKGSEP